jgi:hypothetical protein
MHLDFKLKFAIRAGGYKLGIIERYVFLYSLFTFHWHFILMFKKFKNINQTEAMKTTIKYENVKIDLKCIP